MKIPLNFLAIYCHPGIIKTDGIYDDLITYAHLLNLMEQPTSTTTSTPTFVLDANPLIAAFTSFLQFDVAAGGASAETIRTYWCEAKQYLLWCEVNQLQPLAVTRMRLKSTVTT